MRTGLLAIALTVGLAVGVGVVVSPSEEPATTADPAPAVAIPADSLVIAQSAPCPNRRCPR